jgi:hypothetical protein
LNSNIRLNVWGCELRAKVDTHVRETGTSVACLCLQCKMSLFLVELDQRLWAMEKSKAGEFLKVLINYASVILLFFSVVCRLIKCGVGEAWRRSVGPIMREMKKCYLE